ATLVSQTGPGARSEHGAAPTTIRRLPLGTVNWNVSGNFPARPQLIGGYPKNIEWLRVSIAGLTALKFLHSRLQCPHRSP
ncbi:MAG: hypothetical protein WAO13_08250, partial [Pseudolabrys sp.]